MEYNPYAETKDKLKLASTKLINAVETNNDELLIKALDELIPNILWTESEMARRKIRSMTVKQLGLILDHTSNLENCSLEDLTAMVSALAKLNQSMREF